MTHWTDTFTTRLSRRHTRGRLIRPEYRKAAPGLRGVVVRVIDLLLLWQDRAQSRYRLAQLEDRLLHDIGISRLDALQEAAKPFWRP
jgi:uncharacterized protein YjiS (DUF1127 family)